MAISKRFAVVGAGISGLSAAWLLTKNGHSVTLFEKEESAGGHTLTDASGPVPVDLGFQVYNLTTYGHFVEFLHCLGVETEPSDMSFALSLDQGELEWASHGLDSIFAQRRNLLKPEFWGMVYNVIRFGQKAPGVLLPENASEFRGMALGEYVEREGYGEYFKKYGLVQGGDGEKDVPCRFYLLPMCAAVWSVPFETVLQLPVVVMVRFWVNHHLLDIFQRPVWRVVKGRSENYVRKVLQDLGDVRLGCPVLSVASKEGKVFVETAEGIEEFDSVIMATHSDISLQLLGASVTAEEHEILGAIPYEKNDVYLHTDQELMPKLKSAWASWNFVASSQSGDSVSTPTCVSYWLNRLQNLDASIAPLFVTLNPPEGLPKPETVFKQITLAHPVFSMASMEAQEKLSSIQGVRGIYYAGAWSGYGFHEDGIRSSVSVVQHLGCTIPWAPRNLSPKISFMDSIWLKTFNVFAQNGISRGSLKIVLPNGSELHYGDGNTEPVNSEKWKNSPRLSATVHVYCMDLFRKIVLKTDTGVAEGFMDDDFGVSDMGSLMAIMAVNATNLTQNQRKLGVCSRCGEWLLILAKSFRDNTIKGSRRNIKKHYDIGNAYYKLFLDPTMTYSAGMHSPGISLHDAQLRKLDEAIQSLDLQQGDHVLEIGCGWGSFAIRAAQKTGCKVTGLTLSHEQLREGRERVKAAGLDHLIQLIFCDYRHVKGKKLALWTLRLKIFAEYSASSDFIREYVFPGGSLVCMNIISSYATEYDMSILTTKDVGPDYALTLRQWRKNWVEKKEQLLEARCDLRLHRMFEVYFAYCEAGFDTNYIHDYQITLQRTSSRSPVAPMDQSQTADHFTQVLLAIYFFLAGIMVTNRPYMWLSPLASSVMVIAFAFWRTASSIFSFYCQMQSTEKVWWSTHVVHCFYACFMACLCTCHVFLYGIHHLTRDLPPWELTFYCSPVCITLGFCGFQVWNMVYHRLYVSEPSLLARYTLFLILLGFSAMKVEQVGLITCLLLCEWNVFFDQLLHVIVEAGASPVSVMIGCLSLFEKLTFVTLRLGLQLRVLFALLSQEFLFFSAWSYWLILSFVLFATVANLKRIFSSSFFQLSRK